MPQQFRFPLKTGRMNRYIKFWIASTIVLFLLALWPVGVISGRTTSHVSQGGLLVREAQLVDEFCLSKAPNSGRASNPRSWESVLGANIRIREAAGEAAADVGMPRDRAGEVSALKPGQGITLVNEKGTHYILKSAQGRDWYVVLSKHDAGDDVFIGGNAGLSPSPIAMALALALLGGGLMTLLARVAFGVPKSNE